MALQVALGILQRIGFKEVVCAADGVAALEEIAARGGCDSFDIVLTDLHMPRKVQLVLPESFVMRGYLFCFPCSSPLRDWLASKASCCEKQRRSL